MTIKVQAHTDNLDARIANKIDSTTFQSRFPRQVEHILRLTAERLQNGMRKDEPVPLTTTEIVNLATAMNQLYDIYVDLHD